MSDLDVSLRLRLINLMAGGALDAVRDLKRVQQAAEQTNQAMKGGGEKVPAHLWVDQQKAQAEALRKAQAASDEYFSNLDRRLARLGMIQMGLGEMVRTAERLRKPLEEATNEAEKFEAAIFSLASSADRLGARKQLAAAVLAAARSGNIPWEDVYSGERKLSSLGGGKLQGELTDESRGKMAKLSNIAEVDSAHLYNLYFDLRTVAKLSQEEAIKSLEKIYAIGKKGAFELKYMGGALPQLQAAAIRYGETGKQASDTIPKLLQLLRESSGSNEAAETQAKHLIGKLNDPHYVKKFKDELGVDVNALRRQAIAKGKDPLIVVLDRLAAALKTQVDKAGKAAGTLNPDTEQVEGADPEKLGEVARDYHFRQGLSGWAADGGSKKLEEYDVSDEEARRVAAEQFEEKRKIAEQRRKASEIAKQETEIRAGDTQLGTVGAINDMKAEAARKLGKVTEELPGTTNVLMTAWSAITGAAGALGMIGGALFGLAQLKAVLERSLAKGAAGDVSNLIEDAKKGGPAEAPKPGAAGAEAAKPGLSPETLEKIEQGSRLFVFLSAALDQVLHGAKLLDADYWKNRGITPDAVKKLNEENRGAGGDAGGASAQIGKAIAEAAQKGASNVDMSPAAQATMSKYAGAIEGAEGPAVAAVAALVAKLKAMLDFKATPTIQPRLIAPSGVSPSGGGSAATPGKQSKAGGNVYIQQAHFHGVQDPKKLHEQVMARANRDAAGAHVASLHDIDTGGVG